MPSATTTRRPIGPVPEMPADAHKVFGLAAEDLYALHQASPVGLIVVRRGPPPVAHFNRRAAELLGLAQSRGDAVLLGELPTSARVRQLDQEQRLGDWLAAQLQHGGVRRLDVSVSHGEELGAELLASIADLPADGEPDHGCVISLTDVSGERWLGQQLARRAAQQGLAAAFGDAIIVHTAPGEVMHRAAAAVARGMRLPLAVYLEYAADTDDLVVRAAAGSRSEDCSAGRAEPASGSSTVARAHAQRRTVVDDGRALQARAAPLDLHQLQVAAATPLWNSAGPMGVLAAFGFEATAIHADDLRFLESIAHMACNGLSRLAAEARYRDSVRRLERLRASERLSRAARLSSLGTMASGIAHEVKNPLNSIHVNAELARVLLQEELDPAEADACLVRIQADCQRAAEIADGILAFARGQGDHDREPVAVADLLDGVSRLAANIPDLAEVDLDITACGPEPCLLINRTELEQALINLVQNSCEAGASRVQVTTSTTGDTLQLQVTDNGPGIPDAVATRLFDPFFTTRGGNGGSGLGLSLVHRIITDHGGEIDVQNLASGGCCFGIALPLGAAADEQDNAHPAGGG